MIKPALAVLALLGIFAIISLPDAPPGASAPQDVTPMPWEIETLAGGESRVFGLRLPVDTLDDARQILGSDMEVALMQQSGKPASLEAYYSRINAGILTGSMILVVEIGGDQILALQQRAKKPQILQSGARKQALAAEDIDLVLKMPIFSISFIPSASLDTEIATARFGNPDERVRLSETVEQLFYANKGLSITLDDKGKDVLQYVAPRDSARLRATGL
ncbi:MAG: hypothetical protein Q8O37_01790 [Sulfuricellaceae bacterium]|nr:hypothetical protein [Sulfuricellaceae bacterium]